VRKSKKQNCIFHLAMKHITRTVWILSLVSLSTDTASEMLYPIMPLYLKSIGFSIVLIGILEGFAEAFAGLSKGYFGKISDKAGKRVPFVQIGYLLSTISKPLMAISIIPLWVFFARTLDRLGKGIRTGARDALLSDQAKPETKGRVFGFHRSMDTLGAVLGPLFALLYLYYFPSDYRTLFFIAVIPGFIAVFSSLLLKEKGKSKQRTKSKTTFFSFVSYWKKSPAAYRKLAVGLLFFALVNSSDIFLLLKAKEMGLSDTMVIAIYIFYNLIYALFALPIGILADKIGLKTVLLTGLFFFSFTYFGMAFGESLWIVIALFFTYGIYAASSEGISKAMITNISNKEDTATAVGTFSAFQSIATLFASTLAGFIWYEFGSFVAFILPALGALAVFFYFLVLKKI
jgi:MFS family permease